MPLDVFWLGAGVALIVGGIVFYFLPALIAHNRNSQHGSGVLLVNFFFGWTVIGWIAALI